MLHLSGYGDAMTPRVLITGATGFVGGRLARALLDEGVSVRCLVRDPARAEALASAGAELHRGDVLEPGSLAGAGLDVDVAYYLVHSMGGKGADFAARDRAAARNFAQMAAAEGVGRVVYLGGLGGGRSEHLRSRHETAEVLAEHGPPLTHFRAAMVVGAGSDSYRMLRSLTERLPVMVAPAWLANRTQPIGIDDVIAFLGASATLPATAGREVQVGGPDVLTYAAMIDRMAAALSRRPPVKVPVPLLTPRLSSLWIGLVTDVDRGVARPLVEGLRTDTIVTDGSGMSLFPSVRPAGFDETLRRALAEGS